jgi:actin-related protein
MANNILIIGGSAHLKGFVDELEDRLINKISHYDSEIERVEVIDIT